MRFSKAFLCDVAKQLLERKELYKDITVYEKDKIGLYLRAGSGGRGIPR
jgi:hypothetical protein